MAPGRGLRAVRTAVFAGLCVTTAVGGHTLMSAAAPPAPVLLCAFLLTAALVWRLTGEERSGPAVTGAAVFVQLSLHTVLGYAAPGASHGSHHGPRAPDGFGAGSAAPGHRRHVPAVVGTDTQHSGSASHHPGMHHFPSEQQPSRGPEGLFDTFAHGGAPMLLAHTLAAVLTGLWLWRGERAAFRLLRAFVATVVVPLALLRVTLVPASAVQRPRPLTIGVAPRRLRGAPVRDVISRRGPPTCTAV